MKKQLHITLLLTILMSIISINAFGHDIEVQNNDGVTIYYTFINDNTELAVSCRGDYGDSYSNEYTGNVAIPESVTYNGTTYSVTSIEYNAFQKCSGLLSVTIPNSVKYIENSAFNGCNGLTSLSISNSVESIGDEAFFGCSGILSIAIPDNVTKIGANAFVGTGWYNNQDDGILYLDNWLLGYKGNKPSGEIRIADNTKGMASSSFQSCEKIESVIIPSSLSSISYCAFRDCSCLTNVSIATGVTSIQKGAFEGCVALTTITIPDGIMSIDYSVFYGCSELNNINIPSSVTSIGGETFIGTGWYNNQSDGLIYLDNWLIGYRGDKPIGELTIAEGTKGIADWAFSECSGITSISIPHSVTYIGISAFAGCSGIISVYVPNSVTTIGSSAFSGCI